MNVPDGQESTLGSSICEYDEVHTYPSELILMEAITTNQSERSNSDVVDKLPTELESINSSYPYEDGLAEHEAMALPRLLYSYITPSNDSYSSRTLSTSPRRPQLGTAL